MDTLQTAVVVVVMIALLDQGLLLAAAQSPRPPTLSPSQALELRKGDPGGRTIPDRSGRIPFVRGGKRVTKPFNTESIVTEPTPTKKTETSFNAEKTLLELSSMIKRLNRLEKNLKRLTQKSSERARDINVTAPPTNPTAAGSAGTAPPSMPTVLPTIRGPSKAPTDSILKAQPRRSPLLSDRTPRINTDRRQSSMPRRRPTILGQWYPTDAAPTGGWTDQSSFNPASSAVQNPNPFMQGSAPINQPTVQAPANYPYPYPYPQQPQVGMSPFGPQSSTFQLSPSNTQSAPTQPSPDTSGNMLNSMLLLSTLGGNSRLGAATRESEFMNAMMFMNAMPSATGRQGTQPSQGQAPPSGGLGSFMGSMDPVLFSMAMGAGGNNNNRMFDAERIAESLFRM